MTLRGRIPEIDLDDLDAWGKCDKTGLPTMYRDLAPQMEYAGTGLIWTGLMVSKDHLDEPNPQLMTPPIKPDPVPVNNPRFFPLYQCPNVPTGLTATAITPTSISLSWDPVYADDVARAATNYAVAWSILNSTLHYSTLPLLDANDMTNTVYTIGGLAPGVSYIVSVAAINNVVVGTVSDPHERGTTLSYNLSAFSAGFFQTVPNSPPVSVANALLITTLH